MVSETKAKIVYRELLKEDLVIIRILPETGMPEYKTGQFLTIGVPIPAEKKIVRRAYSIASHPENRDYFEFVIRWVRKPLPGRVTTELFYASVGDEVLLGDPSGTALQISDKLHNGKPDNRRVICVGGGTGIAPFVAFAKHFHDIGDRREDYLRILRWRVKKQAGTNGISDTELQSAGQRSSSTDPGMAMWAE